MKLQKLVIHNIASIEDATIDFEAQPLAGSDVFLITGKTGSGKSTILDAICLALYNKTPRLKNSKMQGKSEYKDEKSINDVCELLRRNTAEASIVLTFIGNNGDHYKASWKVHHSHLKLDGKRKLERLLENLDHNFTLKNSEINPEIQKAVGLDFDQFCRTTMLAQGDFTRFLNSNDEEKASILEKLMGAEIYSKISSKIYAINKEKEQAWKEALQRIEGIKLLTEEELAEKQQTISNLDAKIKELNTITNKELAKRDWVKTNIDLNTNIANSSADFENAMKALECDEYKCKELIVNNWNKTIDARDWMSNATKAATEQKQHEAKIIELRNQFVELLNGQEYDKQEIEKIEEKLKSINSFLANEDGKSTIYANSQTIISHLKAIVDDLKIINDNRAKSAAEEKALNETLLPSLNDSKQQLEKAIDARDSKELEVNAQIKAVEDLELPELRQKLVAKQGILVKIANARSCINTLVVAQEQQENTRKELAELEKSINTLKAESNSMLDPIEKALTASNKAKDDYDKQCNSVKDVAKALRAQLHIGDTCPVCQQNIAHEMPIEEELFKLVSGYKDTYDKAEAEHRTLVEKKQGIDAEIKTKTELFERKSKSLENDKTVSDAHAKAAEACSLLEISEINESTHSALNSLEQKTNDDIATLQSRIKVGETQETILKNLREQFDSLRKNAESLTNKHRTVENAVTECNGRIATAQTIIQSKQSEVESHKQSVAQFIIQDNWDINWEENPIEFANSLSTATAVYNNSVQEKQQLDSKLEKAKINLNNISSIISSIVEKMQDWATLQSTNVAKIENIINKANTISASVETSLSHIESASKKISEYNGKLNDFLSDNADISLQHLAELSKYSSEEISSTTNQLNKIREDVVAKKTLLENAQKSLDEHLRQKPEMAETDTLESLEAKLDELNNEFTQIGERKGAINQELEVDKENRKLLGELKTDVDKKYAEYIKWDRLNILIGASDGNKFKKIALSYILTSLIDAANSYMRTLTDRYSLKVTPGTYIISVEDAYQGYVSRPASTISGGESFLVSLSLALALSDIGKSLAVDTLFIDEGFGTLSGEPLQNAINTLRSLHSKSGRHVGIISHVDELKERIPVQIQVNQEGNSSSSQIKIVPEVSA